MAGRGTAAAREPEPGSRGGACPFLSSSPRPLAFSPSISAPSPHPSSSSSASVVGKESSGCGSSLAVLFLMPSARIGPQPATPSPPCSASSAAYLPPRRLVSCRPRSPDLAMAASMPSRHGSSGSGSTGLRLVQVWFSLLSMSLPLYLLSLSFSPLSRGRGRWLQGKERREGEPRRVSTVSVPMVATAVAGRSSTGTSGGCGPDGGHQFP